MTLPIRPARLKRADKAYREARMQMPSEAYTRLINGTVAGRGNIEGNFERAAIYAADHKDKQAQLHKVVARLHRKGRIDENQLRAIEEGLRRIWQKDGGENDRN